MCLSIASREPLSSDPVETADALLYRFAMWTEYQHGANNAALRELEGSDAPISPEHAVDFLNVWYAFSRRTPQVLLRAASAFLEREDRRLVMQNYIEEDGLTQPEHVPHYDLLELLIGKMGGTLAPDAVTVERMDTFLDDIANLTPAAASGVVAGFEHPALDITRILNAVVTRAGYGHLVTTDPYLVIHLAVEPSHIVWSHSTALRFMRRGSEDADAMLDAFRSVMRFWRAFWSRAFDTLHLTPQPAAS